MQHTTKEEKVRGDMGMGESLSLPGLATELEGLRPHVNIPLVKVFARLEPAYTPRFPRGSVERFPPSRLHVRGAPAPFPPKPFTLASYAAQKGRSPSSVYTWPVICLPY